MEGGVKDDDGAEMEVETTQYRLEGQRRMSARKDCIAIRVAIQLGELKVEPVYPEGSV